MSNLPDDLDRLRLLEAVVRRSKKHLLEMAEALLVIKRDGLYKETHSDWDLYCRDLFEFTAHTADRIITQGEAMKMLPPGAPVPTQREAEAMTRPQPAQRGKPRNGHTARQASPAAVSPPPPVAIDAQARDVSRPDRPVQLQFTMDGLVAQIVSLDAEAAAAAMTDTSYRALMGWARAVQAARKPKAIEPPRAGRPKPRDGSCVHPANRRIGKTCMACGDTVAVKS